MKPYAAGVLVLLFVSGLFGWASVMAREKGKVVITAAGEKWNITADVTPDSDSCLIDTIFQAMSVCFSGTAHPSGNLETGCLTATAITGVAPTISITTTDMSWIRSFVGELKGNFRITPVNGDSAKVVLAGSAVSAEGKIWNPSVQFTCTALF